MAKSNKSKTSTKEGINEDKPLKKPSSKSKKVEDIDEEDDVEDIDDDWETSENDDDWDKDFEEFDLPKSKGRSGGKKSYDDDDDFKMDDEFKDLFGDKNDFDDEDDDF